MLRHPTPTERRPVSINAPSLPLLFLIYRKNWRGDPCNKSVCYVGRGTARHMLNARRHSDGFGNLFPPSFAIPPFLLLHLSPLPGVARASYTTLGFKGQSDVSMHKSTGSCSL